MPDQLQLRGGTTAQHASFTGASKEVTVDTTKKTLVVHDGSTAGGNPLLREDQSNLPTTAPTRGIYNASGSLAISTNGTGRLFVDASGNIECRSYASIGTLGFANANGTETSPTALSTPQLIMNLVARGYDGSAYRQIAAVRAYNDGAVSSTSSPGFLALSTTPSGSTTAQERLRITSAGLVGVGTSSPGYTFQVQSGFGITTDGVTGETRLIAKDPNSNFYKFFSFYTQGANYAERMRIDDQGRVGIGTTTPGTALDVNGVITSRSDSFAAIRFRSSTGTDKAFLSYEDGSTSVFLNNYGSGPIVFKTVDAERVRIDSSGRFLVGTSSSRSDLVGLSPQIQLEGATQSATSLSLTRNEATSAGPALLLAKSRGTTAGAATVVQSGDILGGVYFMGADGTNIEIGAQITGEVDATPGNNDLPSRLVFSTTPDGAASPVERMRIKSDGVVSFYASGTERISIAANTVCDLANSTGLYFGGTNILPANNTLAPVDNTKDLGAAAARWGVLYAGTGTINTSDATLKQDVGGLDVAELKVATAIKGLIKKFRFIDAVANKGDHARIHVGVIAQEVEQAFVAEGLDPRRYALFCEDTLGDGSKRLGIRYDELLAFVIAAL